MFATPLGENLAFIPKGADVLTEQLLNKTDWQSWLDKLPTTLVCTKES